MTEEQVKEKLRAIISEAIEIDEFDDNDEFIRDLGVDSMMTIEIVSRIEKAFKVTIPENSLSEFRDLQHTSRAMSIILKQHELVK
ncbi:acyl carrier protein [Paenibacillus silvestris]|uniref:acyl carrier protein n=1 Tax=Paenibacillus silvestris TaxID=2606219 RepID=UPI001F1612EC|nr:acyl carrier protein [Paenibacillus silvestris]